MKRLPIHKLRNVALISHGGAGKTQLAEAILHVAGVTDRFGKVDDGTTVTDFEPEEIERQTSISSALAPFLWNGHKINLIDTPGYFDFVGEVIAALRIADGAVLLCDAVSGIEVGTEMVWRHAADADVARFIYVSKMDRENADFERVLQESRSAFGTAVVPLQLPVGSEENFRGVVDLVAGRALIEEGGRVRKEDIPADLAPRAAELREQLVEAVAETDDELLEKYFEEGDLNAEDLAGGLRRAVTAGEIVPVLCGSGMAAKGVRPLIDAMAAYMPAPHERAPAPITVPGSDETRELSISEDGPFVGLVFKTLADPYVGKISLFKVYSGVVRPDISVYNPNRRASERLGQLFTLRGRTQEPVIEAGAGDIVGVAKLQETATGDTLTNGDSPVQLGSMRFPRAVYSVAVQPRSQADEDRLGTGLARLMEEDPTFRVERNAETKQLLLYGLGELHLDIITGRLKRKFGVEVDLFEPRVPYRETIRKTVQSEFRYRKQTGGRGQFGHVMLRLEPLPRGGEFEFDEEIFGGAVPRQYIPGVEKGIREAMAEGVLAGYPVTDVKAVLYDGSYHSVDSSEMAFKIASSQAFKKGFLDADPILLEPIVDVEVYVPEEYMGDIMGDLNKRRGRVQGMEPRGTTQIIRALVPLAEMFSYAVDLRSMTQGRGTYTMEVSHYEEVPEHEARRIIDSAASEAL